MAALAAPLLRAEAQTAGPQRLLIIHRPCGTVPALWFPTTGGVKDWGMTPLLTPFADLRNEMVVLKGIDLPRDDNWPGDKHGAGMLAVVCPPRAVKDGWAIIPGNTEVDSDGKFFTGADPSVDQELLKNVASLQGPPIASLQLGASLASMKGSGPECLRAISYAGFNQALWPESRPETVFSNVFANLVLNGDTSAAERSKAKNKSILDFVTGDLTSLRARVPSSQLPKLDAHLAAIRSLEGQFSSGPSAGCSKPTLGAISGTGDDSRHIQVAQQQTQIIQAAFQCDLTRVISLTYSYGNSEITSNAFPGGTGGTGHHEASHEPNETILANTEKFYAETTAQLLRNMKATREGTGTMLDNTLVVYFNECCLGDEHTIPDNPVLLFGGKSLGLNGGSYLQYTGRTFADLWVETFRRVGYNKPVHGDPFWNRGPLSGLYG